jgi:hypothetical protein
MKMGNALLVPGLLLAATAAAAQPGLGDNPSPRQVGISCRDFRLNSDGSWTPVRKVTLFGPNGPFTVEPDEVFRIQLQGTTNYGVKIAEILRDNCL